MVRAFPKRLTQKLIAFFLDNRDLDAVLAYKEKNYTEIPEFTILMYRTEKAKERKEKKDAIKRRAGTLLEESFEDEKVPENVFDEMNVVDENGINFCGEDLIVDSSQKVPLVSKAKIEYMERENARLKEEISIDKNVESKISDDRKRENDYSSYDSEDESPKPKRRKSGKRSPQGCFKKGFKYKGSMKEAADLGLLKPSGKQRYRVSCEVCCRPFHRPIRLYQHQAKEHPKWFAENPPPKKVNGYKNREQILCRICSPNLEFSNKVELLTHQKENHPIWWAKRDAVSINNHMENDMKVNSYEELQIDSITGNIMCNVCGKEWVKNDNGKAARHVEQKHRKEVKAVCNICGQEFVYKDSLRRHMLIHTGEYPEECELCGKKFPSRWKLKHHWETNHKQIECPVQLHYTKTK